MLGKHAGGNHDGGFYQADLPGGEAHYQADDNGNKHTITQELHVHVHQL